ncbi:Uncharacterised protein [Mycobacteroides abscessus subsp. abscessus]|nr:Uncharacterised protein [Mycobacteroides abscessus subsp. abscessus]
MEVASEKISSGVMAVSSWASVMRRAHSSRRAVRFCRRCSTSSESRRSPLPPTPGCACAGLNTSDTGSSIDRDATAARVGPPRRIVYPRAGASAEFARLCRSRIRRPTSSSRGAR